MTSGWLTRALFSVVSVAVCLPAVGQITKPTGGTSQSVWLNYFGDQPFTHRLSVHLEGSYRRTLGLQEFEQYLFRPGLTIVESPHWQSLVAYSYFLSAPTDGGTFGPPPIVGSSPEHRILEQQIYLQRLAGKGDRTTKLTHRFRLEQRWLGTETEDRGVVNWNFSERARYRATFQKPLGRGSTPRHYLAAFNEIYTSFGPHGGKSPFYSDVVYAALGTNTGRFFSGEVGYQYRREAQPGGTTGVNDNSLQVYLLSTLPFRKGITQRLVK